MIRRPAIVCSTSTCDWKSAKLLEVERSAVANTYSEGTGAKAYMDPFQSDGAGLDDEAFLASWTAGAHGQAHPEQEAQLLPGLQVSASSMQQQVQTCSRVRIGT